MLWRPSMACSSTLTWTIIWIKKYCLSYTQSVLRRLEMFNTHSIHDAKIGWWWDAPFTILKVLFSVTLLHNGAMSPMHNFISISVIHFKFNNFTEIPHCRKRVRGHFRVVDVTFLINKKSTYTVSIKCSWQFFFCLANVRPSYACFRRLCFITYTFSLIP